MLELIWKLDRGNLPDWSADVHVRPGELGKGVDPVSRFGWGVECLFDAVWHSRHGEPCCYGRLLGGAEKQGSPNLLCVLSLFAAKNILLKHNESDNGRSFREGGAAC
jgi:hypothetical protein